MKLVKGGHLQRSFLNPRTPMDEEFTRDWLDGRTHTVTGEPLEIFKPAVAPGTMVSICHHMPHAVSPRWEGRGTRLCTLFSYRAPDPEQRIFSPTFTGMCVASPASFRFSRYLEIEMNFARGCAGCRGSLRRRPRLAESRA